MTTIGSFTEALDGSFSGSIHTPDLKIPAAFIGPVCKPEGGAATTTASSPSISRFVRAPCPVGVLTRRRRTWRLGGRFSPGR